MNKIVIQKATTEDKVSWAKGLNSISMDPEFLGQVADSMEQGVLVWDANGLCTMYTDRVFVVLEMRPASLYVGIERGEFLDGALSRGELDQKAVNRTQKCFSRKTPFQFDRLLRSGRIISTAARPLVDGGYVVTFTDVTQQRQESTELVTANEAAAVAQEKLLETLEKEKLRQYEASMLAELGDWLQTCKSLNEIYIVLKEYMRRMIGDSRGELYIYSNSRDVLDGDISWGETDIHDHIKADACWALRRGRNYSFTSEKISFECSHVEEQETPSSKDYICVPIIAHGDTVGLLHIQFLETDSKEKCLRRPHQFAAQCGELISLAIANVK